MDVKILDKVGCFIGKSETLNLNIYFEICFYSSLSGDGAKLFTGTCGRKNAVSFHSLSPMSASDFHWQECEGGANDREGKSRVLFLPGFLV